MSTPIESHKRVAFVGLFGTVVATTMLWFYSTLLIPLLLAMFVTYLLMPVVEAMDRRVPIGRSYSAFIALLILITVIGLSIAGIVPVIKEQVLAIATMIPQARDHIVESWLPWFREMLVFRLGFLTPDDYDIMIRDFRLSSQLGQPSHALQNIMNQTSGVVGGMVNLVLVPVFSFFMLRDLQLIRRVTRHMIPPDIRPIMADFRSDVDRTLRNVLKRQLTVALILAILYMIGLSVAGLKFSLAIGAIAGLCRIVPYLDVVVGVMLALVVIITDQSSFSWSVPIGVAIVFVVVQALDGMFITPRVIGEKVGLHPAIVIASIFAFGDWFGFAGVLLAIPVVAVIKIVLVAAIRAYHQTAFFQKAP